MKHDSSTCGTGAEDTTTDSHASGADLAACITACDALEDDCMEFHFDASAAACTSYSGKCANEAGAATDFIYERVPCCYWTSPTLIETNGICANEDESTMNGGAAAYDFTILENNNADYTLQSCHKLCADYDDNCQSFAYVHTGTSGCKLYLQGVCTATVDGGSTQDLYARSDFKEFPRVTDGLCTHKYYVYE
jgi:hypothetical protein